MSPQIEQLNVSIPPGFDRVINLTTFKQSLNNLTHTQPGALGGPEVHTTQMAAEIFHATKRIPDSMTLFHAHGFFRALTLLACTELPLQDFCAETPKKPQWDVLRHDLKSILLLSLNNEERSDLPPLWKERPDTLARLLHPNTTYSEIDSRSSIRAIRSNGRTNPQMIEENCWLRLKEYMESTTLIADNFSIPTGELRMALKILSNASLVLEPHLMNHQGPLESFFDNSPLAQWVLSYAAHAIWPSRESYTPNMRCTEFLANAFPEIY